MDKQFMVIKNYTLECTIFDRKREVIVKLEYGRFTDQTEACKKMYEKEANKPKTKKGKKIGGLWYGFLIGAYDRLDACIWKDEILLETDDMTLFDAKILELQKAQITHMLDRCNKNMQGLHSNKPYHTYAFCNY